MDSIEDSLNMDSSMGVDFAITEDTGVHDGDVQLDGKQITMDFEDQSVIMEPGDEEIIVTDFMGELQEYSIADTTAGNPVVEANQSVLSQAENIMDLQLEPVSTVALATQPKFVTLKTLPKSANVKKQETTSHMPRQIAIAPKPPPKAPQKPIFAGKQMSIAPRPVALVARKYNASPKFVPSNVKGNNVIHQISGKQLVIVPKIKLVTSTASNTQQGMQVVTLDTNQVQMLSKNIGVPQMTKPVVMKIPVQTEQQSADQATVAAKMLPTVTTAQTQNTHYLAMHKKTVPVSIANKRIPSTPVQNIKIDSNKQRLIAIKTPTKVVTSGTSTMQNKVVVDVPQKNIVLRTLTTAKVKVSYPQEQPKMQLHQINVPGKGVQYIRLVTNPTTTTTTKVNMSPQPTSTVASKNIVLTDDRVTGKPQQKLVRIAPLGSKMAQAFIKARSSQQSLLAPMTQASDAEAQEENSCEMQEQEIVETDIETQKVEEVDSKDALSQLLMEAVAGELQDEHNMTISEVEVESDVKMSPVRGRSSNSVDQEDYIENHEEHPLIIIPPAYEKKHENINRHDETMMNVDIEENHQWYRSPNQIESDTEIGGIRPRKACNCTKSQCLKLYCDCFASGEFCNHCNCVNCHNNLQNEELRQKAIRGCLERNPHAFKPKIGKAKTGGVDIIRQHNKGCNCKKSGCLKNYCECFEAKIACTAICKCVGCRNVEDKIERRVRREQPRLLPNTTVTVAPRQPCSFMTNEVIEAVCQCLLAAASETNTGEQADPEDSSDPLPGEVDPIRDVIDEFSRCLQDIIGAAQQTPVPLMNQG